MNKENYYKNLGRKIGDLIVGAIIGVIAVAYFILNSMVSGPTFFTVIFAVFLVLIVSILSFQIGRKFITIGVVSVVGIFLIQAVYRDFINFIR